jgi:alginate O-acetyltransferase complex protein AlgI
MSNPMLFTEPLFLFFFLPVVLGLYFLTPRFARNAILLAASLVFYALGEGFYALVLVGSMLINYFGALGIDHFQTTRYRRLIFWAAIAANILLLAFFKYTHFLAVNLNEVVLRRFGQAVPEPSIHLPIGISFFTFMGLSYVIDVYRRQLSAQKRPVSFALYLTLFPHLIAGPIVRYGEIAAEIAMRRFSRPAFAEGVRRFVIGLGKKMLIANSVAVTVDLIFKTPSNQLTPATAWLGIICYALQIYFDFSGYSDMAIGLARMFGFHFPENFNYPYISQSITEFWRRWHITLSNWFRDYLFFPLGVRGPRWRLYLNLLIVFFLCGLWHGASRTFIIWGLFHGTFLVFERAGLLKWMARWPRVLRHVYLLLVVLVGWVFFRSETVPGALSFLGVMTGLTQSATAQVGLRACLNNQLLLALALGLLGSTPLVRVVQSWAAGLTAESEGPGAIILQATGRLLRLAALAAVFVACAALSAAGTYNPFIYFRF